VGKGRISLNEFVALTATNHARMYGLAPRKGTLEPGADADLAIWDPDLQVRLTASIMKDNVGYTPYEGRIVKGWPTTVMLRGQVIVADGVLLAARGSGEFLPCGTPAPIASQAGRPQPSAASTFRKLIAG